MTKTIVLAEALDIEEAQIDTENRILRNVVLIKAGKSLNKRYYSETALQNAVSVFEGSKAFDSHAKGERRVGELTGYYQNVRYENSKLIADRHFLPTRAGQDVMAVVEAIKNGAPRSLAGLSINAVGTGKMGKFDGEDLLQVESITTANSVDDVVSPAAGGSYILTASTGDELANAFIQQLSFEEWFESRPEFIKRVQNEMKAVRQDDAVKVAKANADQLTTALQEAEALINTLKVERDAALVEARSKARELVVVETLNKVQLPITWKKSLREQLLDKSDTEWEDVIQQEIAKARSGGQPRIGVSGAGQQIAPEITESMTRKTVINWAEVKTPEDQARALAELQRSQK